MFVMPKNVLPTVCYIVHEKLLCHQLFKKEPLTLRLWRVMSQSSVLSQENKFLKKHVRSWKAEGDCAWWVGVAEHYGKLLALPRDSSMATCMLYSLFAPQLLSLVVMAAQPSSHNDGLQWNKQTILRVVRCSNIKISEAIDLSQTDF